MKTRYSIIFLFTFISFLSCTKEDRNNFGDKTITGRLFYKNNISGNGLNTVLANIEVRLSFEWSASYQHYDAITTSNTDGYFTFKNLPDRPYNLFVQTKVNNVTYTYSGPNVAEVILTPDTHYLNGLAVTATDSVQGYIPALKVGLYSSRLLALNDTAYNYTVPVTTNNYGIAFFPDQPAGTYYLAVHDSIGDLLFTAFDTVVITEAYTPATLGVRIR